MFSGIKKIKTKTKVVGFFIYYFFLWENASKESLQSKRAVVYVSRRALLSCHYLNLSNFEFIMPTARLFIALDPTNVPAASLHLRVFVWLIGFHNEPIIQ